jgi:uncharacterized membrane protein
MGTAMPASETAAAAEDRTVAIVGYLTIIGFIAAIVIHMNNKTRLGAFHLRQTLGLVVTGVAAGVCSVVPILGWIVWIVVTLGLVVLWLLGILSALRGDMRPVPILGEHYQKWFAGAFQ